MARRRLDPFETEITHLGKGGVGVGRAPDGAPVHVRFAPPGGRVAVMPGSRRKGVWSARRAALVRPPAAYVIPRCDRFGVCGGCQLQELAPAAQRAHKHRAAVASIASAYPDHALPDGLVVHPPRSTPRPYGYRNKVELTFGSARYLSEADHAAGLPIAGRFLGFHAPGRFDRVVDAPRCEIAAEPLNVVLARTREVLLADGGPAPYDPRAHTGFLRHLLLRYGAATGEVLAVLYTASPASEADRAAALAWGAAIHALELDGARVASVAWAVGDGWGDAAHGEVAASWGAERLRERLGAVAFTLSATSFFQTNTAGAEILYDTVGEALGDARGALVDLYCGTGAIGLFHAHRFERLVGVEERPEAVEDARRNAAASGIDATFVAARVEEAVDRGLLDGAAVVVDPPRAGLHPAAARTLAACDATHLVYVACHPESLGRDAQILAEGGWRLAALWTVDLFPHTGHMEAVARFCRG